MNKFLIYLYFSVLILAFPFTVDGQNTQDERDSLVKYSLDEAISLYDRTLKQNSFIYTGRIYSGNYDDIRGHPYFSGDSWNKSTIVFKGETFDSVLLMYDIYNDQVLLKKFNEKGMVAPIILNGPDIQSFDLFGHAFIYLEGDSVSHLPDGIYNKLYSGRSTELYAKRKKEIIVTAKRNDLWEDFRENDLYYLKKDGLYYRVKDLKSLLKKLKEPKKELRAYMRNNNLYYLENFEEALLKAVFYFENL